MSYSAYPTLQKQWTKGPISATKSTAPPAGASAAASSASAAAAVSTSSSSPSFHSKPPMAQAFGRVDSFQAFPSHLSHQHMLPPTTTTTEASHPDAAGIISPSSLTSPSPNPTSRVTFGSTSQYRYEPFDGSISSDPSASPMPINTHSLPLPPSTSTNHSVPAAHAAAIAPTAAPSPSLSALGLRKSPSTGSLHSHGSSVNIMHAQDEELYQELNEIGPLTIRRLQAALAEVGMHPNDPRLKQVHARLNANASDELTLDNFKYVIESASMLIYRALTRKLVIPDWSLFIRELDQIYRDSAAACTKGRVASYIPELANAEPNTWAMSFCSIDGQQHGAGDTNLGFSIQSGSKPLNYLMALEEHGEEYVHRFVGREPSGRNFNELCLNNVNIPHNPMINAGAIMVGSLIQHGKADSERFGYILNCWKKLTGYSRDISFNNTVYLSEKATANRNFCLAYLMQERRAFQYGADKSKPPREWKDTDLQSNLDLYFSCCSIEATTQAMSVAAATLANGGVCPLTGERIFQAEYVKNCLSLMLSCGMYDYSGEWGFVVGLPAKSGVSGCIMIVIPNVGGLALHSPLLDELGNSARGIEFSKRLAQRFGLHFLNFTNRHKSEGNKASAENVAGHEPPPIPTIASAATSARMGHSSGVLSRPSAPSFSERAPLIRNKPPTKYQDLSIAFIFACAQGDMGLVRSLMASAVDMNAANYDGRTPLHVAASNGHLDIVQLLIRKGVEINPVDRVGGTPLADAIREGHLEVVNFLRQQDAQLADPDEVSDLDQDEGDGEDIADEEDEAQDEDEGEAREEEEIEQNGTATETSQLLYPEESAEVESTTDEAEVADLLQDMKERAVDDIGSE